MNIPIILGTIREGRQSEKAASFMLKKTLEKGFESEIIDVRDYLFKNKERLSEKIKKADALIFVFPEYNHGYPGELKIMTDMLYSEYKGKPVGFCGVSSGGLGGARAVEQMRLVVIEFHMVPIREAVYFSNIKELFDDKGGIRDDSYNKRTDLFLEELSDYARKLKK